MKITLKLIPALGFLAITMPALGAPEPIPTLYNTGVDNSGVPRAHGARESHYEMIDPSPILGEPFIFTSKGGFPVPPWVADDARSAWIVPTRDASADPVDWHYQLTFDLAGFDPASVVIDGNWSTDNVGQDILVNGESTGIGNTVQFPSFTPFSLVAAFKDGLNTIDFVVNNAPPNANPGGVRVEMAGTAERSPAGLALEILTPPADASIQEGAAVKFAVSVRGSSPVTYQWFHGNTAIAGATSAILPLSNVLVDQAGAYRVEVTNPSGTQSASANLEIAPTALSVTRVPGLVLGGIAGRLYNIESIDDLAALPNWVLFSDVGNLASDPLLIPLPGDQPRQFFRGVEVEPPPPEPAVMG